LFLFRDGEGNEEWRRREDPTLPRTKFEKRRSGEFFGSKLFGFGKEK
jgi:hypothetical protein